MGLWSYVRWEYVLLCVVVDTGVGIAFCCWWVVAVRRQLGGGAASWGQEEAAEGCDSWAGIARRGSVLLCRGGGNGIGNACRDCARRECVLLLRASGVRDWHWVSGLP